MTAAQLIELLADRLEARGLLVVRPGDEHDTLPELIITTASGDRYLLTAIGLPHELVREASES